MTINVQYPNPSYSYNFDIKGAFIADKELFLVGYHQEHKQLSVIGIIVKKNLDGLCYSVKQQKSQKYYDKLIDCPVGSNVKIYSDVSSGMWGPVDAIKIDLQPVIDVIKRCTNYKDIMKTPGGFMIPN